MEIIVPVLLLAAAVGLYAWYASIIGRRNRALEALGSVDAHLQQRADLVPNLLKAARRFMEHESELLSEVTALRERVTAPYDRKDPEAVSGHLAAAEALGAKLGAIRVQMEAYPDLKSDRVVDEAMEQMGEVEAQITAARRFYNAAVTRLNDAVQIFPGDKIAAMANVKPMPYFEAAEAARAAPDADAYLR